MSSETPHVAIHHLAEELSAELYGAGGDAVALDVTHDSRQVREGTVFVAIKGSTVDGHRFVNEVARRGAVAIISEFYRPETFEGAWIRVPDARFALAKAAAVINGNPSHDLNLIGITGTNGKTTTTYLAFAFAEAAKRKAAMLTTVEYRIGERSVPAIRTTPDASDTNRFLRNALTEGCSVAVMEASSQAIDLHRCDWLRFCVAVFTNLTRDHLDYHETMEEYFDAKRKLFDGRLGERPGSSVINIDDEWGRKLADDLRAEGERVVTTSQLGEADLSAADIEVSLVRGTGFTLKTPAGSRNVTSPLVGRPHVYNILSAAAAALEIGVDLDEIVAGIETCVGAPGRFERVEHARNFAVIVDYAHTDDALLNTLKTANELTTGQVITVFGCGGDRDKTKRAPMGEIAGRNSDVVIVTSDNPRNEDPMRIISEIEAGLIVAGKPYEVIPDRREAIHRAIALAGDDDVIIIAGKGHENYQVVGSDKFHFDDREAAREALAVRADR